MNANDLFHRDNDPVGKTTGVRTFQPTVRPPVAVLTVCDDGKESGEMVRIRSERFIIGRSEGHLILDHDDLISGRHLEITRQFLGRDYRWIITDLNSTNGMFVRIRRGPLDSGSEFLIGNGRYRFESAMDETEPEEFVPYESRGPKTRYQGQEFHTRYPALVELVGGQPQMKLQLIYPEYWIGTHPECVIARPDDPFADPKHARLFRDDDARWWFENNNSVNGIWLRQVQWEVRGQCKFQIGEQRFKLDVPAAPG
ncbi:FHA domain-containing protein [Limnoglobus roseus]|uniref:FHA domain-containing protein n=1 Tax=Limnoglobus roseus TaxID=2598579 RepID=A0A5C1ALC3_9BACT|nr:FHA domain-containing protein [Limnoglobus roseus]QEL20031.1 FHA domain-containing protein [Limnoglobus roseus]